MEDIFNMAVLTLDRINMLLTQLSGAWISGNFILIKNLLRELRKEVHPFLDEKERTLNNDKWERIEDYSFKKTSKVGYKFDPAVVIHLQEYDIWLRIKLKEKRLLMNLPGDARFSL